MESIVVNDTMLVLVLYGIVVYGGRMEREEIVCSSVKDVEERQGRSAVLFVRRAGESKLSSGGSESDGVEGTSELGGCVCNLHMRCGRR
jgi:hypothetical protein